MKVLVVDDEVDIKDLFEQRFRREIKTGEFQLEFAHSGEEALGYLTKYTSDDLLILSDVNMPGMSGFELLQKIRANFKVPPVHVVMITAYGDPASQQKAVESGANGFLTKPLDFAMLKQKMRSLA